jgi:3-oxoisoapionate kinase
VSADPATRLLYTWYGDDFTGSTDVLEALALHGVKAVLFTHTPSSRDIAAFSDCRAVGIAGESRSRSPQWMNRNLPAIFRAMRRPGAPVNHYKVCSTFDSSPRVGSIGRAMELGRAVFRAPCFAPALSPLSSERRTWAVPWSTATCSPRPMASCTASTAIQPCANIR